ncbi:hypothetical protein MUK42_05380 [Musa troglodytarum]|uniref:Uncharacterized protein n=1 Tax=Musa troglodytarum TaxID=320322 RepID=A0A9E7GT25_9LILI|nr:hypothetical protein MUK42_05380 [Musa troglodytarum]
MQQRLLELMATIFFLVELVLLIGEIDHHSISIITFMSGFTNGLLDFIIDEQLRSKGVRWTVFQSLTFVLFDFTFQKGFIFEYLGGPLSASQLAEHWHE